MPAVIFSHDGMSSLVIDVGIERCSWGYSLNSQTYPTYGGEVVQMLSVFIDDIELGGTVETYKKMEDIYGWFMRYMQLATQDGHVATPLYLSYPHRGWDWQIFPESLPGFRYGREVVAPEWSLTAKVHEADDAVKEVTLDAAVKGLERIPLGIGFEEENPFSDPLADPAFKGKNKKDLEKWYEDAVDQFVKLVPKYMEGDYESLLGNVGSKPAFLDPKVDDKDRPGDKDKPSEKR